MQSLLEQYECSICQNVYTHPVCIKQCRHNFCRSCIEMTLDYAKSRDYQ